MRVLIVDDEPFARATLANILSRRSDVELLDSASDAADALNQLQKSIYDVMLLDIDLPVTSGIELLDLVQKSSRLVPSIIFVAAHDERAVTAFEKHAVDYVLKP